MSDAYPLTKAMGVETFESAGRMFVFAGDLERALEQAPVVAFNDDKTMSPTWECSSAIRKDHTHTARLVCVQPIVKESEERQLLRALVTADLSTRDGYDRYHDAHDRARALLSKGE